MSPHGIPLDLLDRVMIIRTMLYTPQEMKQVRAVLNTTLKVSGIPAYREIRASTCLGVMLHCSYLISAWAAGFTPRTISVP